jgi:serine O-acetyltransferase
MAKAGGDALADDTLTQDFDAHVLFTFAEIPAAPPLANRVARVKRWFLIAFVESWLAVWLYRAKMRLRASGVLVLPGMCDMISRVLFRVQIGDRVEIGPGLMMTHGNVVIDGRTKVGRRCQINPWVTIGLSNSKKLGFSVDGPTIGDYVHIGTGAKVLGPITVGDYARIGANAVVVHDVPPNTTVVGTPARVIGSTSAESPAGAPTNDGSGRDERLASHMRQSIIDYKLGRQSLKSLVDTLIGSFDIAGDPLRDVQTACTDDLIFLDAVAVTGGEESQQVSVAVDAIAAAIDSFA